VGRRRTPAGVSEAREWMGSRVGHAEGAEYTRGRGRRRPARNGSGERMRWPRRQEAEVR
jgi:hypothetical protein